ncbi:Dabb family protein [Spongiimicrobium salis]|uniref:Dabb family protein n=1 Tax=Spongiimicrobium salis TaxID=1667022 RepID=UPI00374D5E09
MNNTKIKLPGILLLFFLFTSIACQEKAASNQKEDISESTMDKTEKQEKLLRHVVIFKFNEESTEEDVNRLNQAFNALADSIPVIQDFEWGLNDSPENFHQGFTHCYLLTFASEADRDSVYTPHPQHQAFVQSLQPHLEKVFVVDYWTNP